MIDKLPILSGKEIVKALCRLGYTINDLKGSHIYLRHPVRCPLTVLNHSEVARGTLRIIIKDADLAVEKFLVFL